MKRIIKCGTAFLLALVLCLCLLPTTAFAASNQVYIWNFPLSDDTLKSSGNWGHGVLDLRFGYRVGASSYTQFRCLDSWQGEVAYCIEPGAPQKNYDSLTDHNDTWWDHLTLPDGHPLTPREVQRLIGRIMSYGYHGTIGGGWWADVESTAEKMAWAYATQVLIWEVVAGERDSSFRHIDVKSMGYNEALERVDATHPLRGKILSYYDSIVDSVQTHSKRPSFCGSLPSNAGTLELSWDGSKFVGSVTDTNGMLGKYSFSCEDADLTFSKNGDVLTVSTEKPISDAVTITAAKEGTTSAGMVVWGDGVWGEPTGIQDVVTYSASVRDPVTAYLKIKTAAIPGRITVKKVDAEGAPLPGIRFLLESSADQVNWRGEHSGNGCGRLGLLGRFDSRRRHLLPGDGGAGGGGNDAAGGAFVFGDAGCKRPGHHHYRLQQCGLCAALYGRGGIHNLYSVCGTHARHGCRHGCLFLQKNHDEKGELNDEENKTTLGAAPGCGHGLGAGHHGVRGADH